MTLLDTDRLTLLEWMEDPDAVRLVSRLKAIPVSEVGTTIVTFEEKVRGWLASIASARTMRDAIDAYAKLNRQVRLFCSMSIVDFDDRAAAEFQRLRKLHRRVGTLDLRIASIVQTRDARLISRNLRDFQPILGDRVQDWTTEKRKPT